MEGENLKFHNILGERSRRYVYADGSVVIENVVRICVRSSGTHRLETADGSKWIVASGWRAVAIDADDWSL